MRLTHVLNHRNAEKHKDKDDILYSWIYQGQQPAILLIWHWCPTPERDLKPQWRAAGTKNHRIISEKPLTLDPSLAFSYCCGLHGHITDGQWIEASKVEVTREN